MHWINEGISQYFLAEKKGKKTDYRVFLKIISLWQLGLKYPQHIQTFTKIQVK